MRCGGSASRSGGAWAAVRSHFALSLWRWPADASLTLIVICTCLAIAVAEFFRPLHQGQLLLLCRTAIESWDK